LLTSKFDFLTAVICGAIVGGLLGWIKGGVARRVRNDFFAVATLAIGLLIRQTIINLSFAGGMGGIGSIAPPHFFELKFISQDAKYYVVLTTAIALAWASRRMIASRTGRAWLALSDDEGAALAAGVDTARMRTLVLIVSSAFAGIAGVLYASTLSFVDPDIMAFHVSSMVLTMVILGGAGNVEGVVIGAILIVLYDKVIVPQLADWIALIWPFAIGSAPDIRGASFFNFGIALYLTVLIRARRK
jgi:branched-chain amino acid transport system permease protein